VPEWHGAAHGVSILDFTWYGVGPITTKYLADNGALVVKVESNVRPDGLRLLGPWKDAEPGNLNNSQFFASFNSSKKSISLNLSKAEARDIVRRLVPHFDIVAENFTPRTMDDWGLGYADLIQLRPDLIMLSSCMQGQTGPHAHYPGFGQLMASLSGFYYLSGYSSDEIAPPYGAYTDFVVPRMAAFAVLAALEHRRRTGAGQSIDISQFEASLYFMAPVILDYLSGGPMADPRANRSDRYAPHGAYQFADEEGGERWATIAVANDAQWAACLGVLGDPGDPRFATIVDRLEKADALDAYIQRMVRHRDACDIVKALQAAGVAAYPVQNCLDLHADQNLVGFEFWQWLEQRDAGYMPYDGLSYRLDRTGSNQFAAPSLGEHTEEILGETLGMSGTEIARLRQAGVVN
jgi:benzylsuccinate CoA-transferase BbsF subunit